MTSLLFASASLTYLIILFCSSDDFFFIDEEPKSAVWLLRPSTESYEVDYLGLISHQRSRYSFTTSNYEVFALSIVFGLQALLLQCESPWSL